MTTISETMRAAIDSAPVGTTGLVIEPWSIGETYGVAANWAQASAPVYFFGSGGWNSRQYQVADFRHRKTDALELELMETLRASGDDETGAAELLDDAVAF